MKETRDYNKPSIVEGCSLDEVMLCVHVLCVSKNLNDRPSMPAYLGERSKSLGAPNTPAYFARRNTETEQIGGSSQNNNTVTLTVLEGR